MMKPLLNAITLAAGQSYGGTDVTDWGLIDQRDLAEYALPLMGHKGTGVVFAMGIMRDGEQPAGALLVYAVPMCRMEGFTTPEPTAAELEKLGRNACLLFPIFLDPDGFAVACQDEELL